MTQKKRKVQRQGLIITLRELTNLKMELIKQQQELQKGMKIKDWHYVDYGLKFQINIINKEGLSDTWEIE